MNEKRFYKEMITLADREFSQHLTKSDNGHAKRTHGETES